MPARAKFEFTAEDRTKRGIDSVKQRLRGLSKFAKATAAAGAAAAAAAAVGLRGRAQEAKDFAATARLTGLSAKQVQALGFAAEKAGASAGGLADGVKDMNERIGEALVEGTGPLAPIIEELDKMGIVSRQQWGNFAPIEALVAFMAVADQASTQARRTRLLEEMFGGSGAEAVGRFESAADFVDKLAQGLAMANTPQAQSGLEALNAELERMAENFDKIGRAITDQLIGPATEAVKTINSLLERPDRAVETLGGPARAAQLATGATFNPAALAGDAIGRAIVKYLLGEDKKQTNFLAIIADRVSASSGAVAQ